MSIAYQTLEPHQYDPFLRWRGQDDAYTLEVLQQELLRLESGMQQIFVAVEKGQFIGTVQLVFVRPDLRLEFADSRDSAYIQALEVNPQRRRKGVARGLMAALESAARASNFKRLTLMVETDNEPAIRLYEALGYSEFERSSWTWKGVVYPTVCLEKILSRQP